MGLDMYLNAKRGDINVQVGYWRKVNSVHGWFVRECADGVDDCRPVSVSREKLYKLRDLCKGAIDNKPRRTRKGVSSTRVLKTNDIGEAIKQEWAIQLMEREFNDPNDTDPLRPTGGFFFGSTEKDEYYYEDLRETIRILDDVLAMSDDWEFEYCASW